ncbi:MULTISPECIES: zinc-binding dehydrogenase [unclassified Beijerinckia]|uniref:quinone oxidoreductase family protein n=1 Tax=unclassified Beijerinckia TaxID=2638183 RepID=UPI000895F279|nr:MULTISPECIES: zinc-binding dehydrogenase [unclassified Beijerinckia]MDH7797420.1 NADPH2:quinone reductase [Beijerinckia sp. GAS462]SEC84798.1 NADPH:quinone reductase [Beijerinckia sp. 28-YEA-48]
MKAAVLREFGPPDVLKYEEVADPQPRSGEVRIRVGGATVNRVLDVSLRRGEEMQRTPVLPLILGVDCAGTIDAVGPGVTRWKVGDRVAAAGGMPLDIVDEDGSSYTGPRGMMGIKRPGGFADLVCVPAMATHRLPDGLGFHEAAVVMRHCPTAWNLLVNIAKLQKDEWVLILGASGNLGTVGIQIAKNVIGAKVIGAASRKSGVDVALALGADHGIDSSTQDLTAEVMKITGGKGVNVLYDNVANPDVLPKAFLALGMEGRMVTAGAHGGPNATINFHHLYDKRIMIKGTPGSREGDLAKCFQAAAEGKIQVRIAHVLPLSKAAQAHAMIEADPGMGKIVLDPTMG